MLRCSPPLLAAARSSATTAHPPVTWQPLCASSSTCTRRHISAQSGCSCACRCPPACYMYQPQPQTAILGTRAACVRNGAAARAPAGRAAGLRHVRPLQRAVVQAGAPVPGHDVVEGAHVARAAIAAAAAAGVAGAAGGAGGAAARAQGQHVEGAAGRRSRARACAAVQRHMLRAPLPASAPVTEHICAQSCGHGRTALPHIVQLLSAPHLHDDPRVGHIP